MGIPSKHAKCRNRSLASILGRVKEAELSSDHTTHIDRKVIAALIMAPLLILARFLFAWPPPLIYPTSSLGTDLPREIWPLAYWIKHAISTSGTIPLWRSYLLSGAPIIGHPVAPIFYPPHWLILPFPISLGLNLDLALHLAWMSVGTYLYARLHAGMRWRGALVSAMLFAFSPMWFAHISGGHLPMLVAIAWWPWIWLGWNRYFEKGSIPWILLAAAGFAAQLMNHGMIFMLSLLGVGIFTTYKLIYKPKHTLSRAIQGWALSISVTFLLSAIHLLPFLELLPLSTRAAISAQDAQFGSLPLPLLMNALLPPELAFPEWYLYPGVGAIALTIAILSKRGHRRKWTAVAVIVAILVMALGANTPLFDLFRIVPGISLLRVPARWWLFALFAFAILSGWAIDRWFASPPSRSRTTSLTLVGVGLLYFLILGISVLSNTSLPFIAFPAALLMMLIIALLLSEPRKQLRFAALFVVLGLDLIWTGNALLRPQPPPALEGPGRRMSELEALLGEDERILAPYGGVEMAELAASSLQAAGGYDSFALQQYARTLSYASGCAYDGYSASAPPMAASPTASALCSSFSPNLQLLSLLNIRYVLLPDPSLIPDATPKMRIDDLWVYELPPGRGRAFGVSRGQVGIEETCPDVLGELDIQTTALIETALPFVEGGTPPEVLAHQGTWNSESFEVATSDPGLLIRSESWAPGWRATIDGRDAPVLRVNCTLQGLWLERGDQHVQFTYLPESYQVGRAISLASAVGLLLGMIVWLARRKRKQTRAPSSHPRDHL